MTRISFEKIWRIHRQNSAIIDGDVHVTYQTLNLKVINKIKDLHERGISAGDRVALFGKAGIPFIVNFLALLHMDAIAVPLSIRLTETQIQDRIRSSSCTQVLLDKSISGLSFPSSVRIIELEDTNDLEIDRHLPHLPLTQCATILFTSGSTGLPKAIMHTIGNHYYSAGGSEENIPLKPGDRWLIVLPLYHVGGLSIIFRTLLAGAAMVIPRKNLTLARNLRDFAVTHVSLVQAQLVQLLDENFVFPELKAILLGGSALSQSVLHRAIHTRLPLRTSYGSTEMASQIATAAIDTDQITGTSGTVLRHRLVRIAPDGEVLVKGKTLSPGYVEGNQLYPIVDDDSWFHTGDLGSLDSQGRLTIVGRKDNMFISGGENIYPEEIESILCSHPQIINAVVVEIPDEKFGFRPVAFVNLRPDSRINAKSLHRFLAGKIEKFKIPLYFLPWPDVVGDLKTSRKELRKIAREKINKLGSGD